MAPQNLPAAFNATNQDVEMMLAAQTHLGSKNLQVHMEPYLWKTRPDGINVINIGKTWYVGIPSFGQLRPSRRHTQVLSRYWGSFSRQIRAITSTSNEC
jgi:small subunit ribosomal protein SAe